MPRITRHERSVRALFALDDRLRTSGRDEVLAVPAGGWIRTVREARGISQDQLGRAIGITRSSVNKLEEREVDGGATLHALVRAAKALGCTLEYRLVPPSGDFARFLGAGPPAVGVAWAPAQPSLPAAPAGTAVVGIPLTAVATGSLAPPAAATPTMPTVPTAPSGTGAPSASTASSQQPPRSLHDAYVHAWKVAVEGPLSNTEMVLAASRAAAPDESVDDPSLRESPSNRTPKPRGAAPDTGQLDVFGE